MGVCRALLLASAASTLFGCTSDPNAPINQVFPIPQMDAFFRSLQPPPPNPKPVPQADAAGGTFGRGYAPAYPPYPTK